jgi:hypothetical protein
LCGISDIKCYQNAIQETIEKNIQKYQVSDCDCLPTCNSIAYETEVNQIVHSNESIRHDFVDRQSLMRYGCTVNSDDYEYDEYDYNQMTAFEYVRKYR